jgi:hypothetical protein
MLDPTQYEFLIFIYYFNWAGAETSDIPAPAPAKSSGSSRLRLQNTDHGVHSSQSMLLDSCTLMDQVRSKKKKLRKLSKRNNTGIT